MSLNFDQFNSIVSLFHHQVKLFQDKPYLWKKIDGKYISLTWKQVREQVDVIAKGLINRLFFASNFLNTEINNINKLIANNWPSSTPRLKPKRVLSRLFSEKPTSKRKPPNPKPCIKPKIEAMTNEKNIEWSSLANMK